MALTQPRIGTLNEGELHRELKSHYAIEGSRTEQCISGFVADVVVGNCIYEIQTAQFGSLKRKLPVLLESYNVVLVYPIAETKTLVKHQQNGVVSQRKSPKTGSLADLFSELVYIPTLIDHPRMALDVAFIHEEEHRRFCVLRRRQRKPWVVLGRRLIELKRTVRIHSMAELFNEFFDDLPERFTTQDVAMSLKRTRSLGQKVAYCFRKAGVLEVCGKKGNSLVYKQAEP